MVKLLTLAALLAGISTYVLHSERASVTAPLPTTKFDQLNRPRGYAELSSAASQRKDLALLSL